MLPDGRFVAPLQPGPLDRVLTRVGAAFALVALAVGGLAMAGVALLVVRLLLPLAVGAGLVAMAAFWWRPRRLRRQGGVPPIPVVIVRRS